ncbi:SpoIIE family protein phosphatase [Streptomyces sp. NPDC052207]|uniref:PP2C family protein-serine/threonine phosphatase n=1 Tax=Streptomyces sp. NPDC052207 TaxID=3155418 RepID=UPI0034187FDD
METPLLITPDEQVHCLSAEPDAPLGVDVTMPRSDHTHPVPAGSTVVLYTDGLIERREQPIDVGLGRLIALAGEHVRLPLRTFVQALIDQHPSDGHDDQAVLALRPPPP